MAGKLYSLFVFLADADYFAGVYDSEQGYKDAIKEIEKQIETTLEDYEYTIMETEMNKLEGFMVTEFEDDEDEE